MAVLPVNVPARRPSRAPLASLLLAAALTTTAGCAGSLDDPERFTDGGAQSACPPGTTATSILQTQCLACHSTASRQGDLDLEAPGLPGRLYTTNSVQCGDERPLADSNNPANSYFLNKLSPDPACGVRMPQGGQLSQAQVACLAEWLAAGNGGAP